MRNMQRIDRESLYGDPSKYERCEYCANCTYIGDGDYICDAGITNLPLVDYQPSEDYYWCKGRFFQPREVRKYAE